MKALCWHGKNDIRCDSVPDPQIEDGRDVIIKMTAYLARAVQGLGRDTAAATQVSVCRSLDLSFLELPKQHLLGPPTPSAPHKPLPCCGQCQKCPYGYGAHDQNLLC